MDEMNSEGCNFQKKIENDISDLEGNSNEVVVSQVIVTEPDEEGENEEAVVCKVIPVKYDEGEEMDSKYNADNLGLQYTAQNSAKAHIKPDPET